MNHVSPLLRSHVTLLCDSCHYWLGKPLLDEKVRETDAVTALALAPFAVVSHDTAPDPMFNYANQLALSLFEMDWAEFTSLPSRVSAEPMNQAKRSSLLERVAQQGFIENYAGVRIAKSGRRFMIEKTTIWNLIDHAGEYRGQAAMILEWHPVSHNGSLQL